MAAVAACVSMSAFAAHASVINFDDQGLTGPSLFASTSQMDLNLNIDGVNVTFEGGTILDNTAFLPGNSTAVYGTADFAGVGYTNPLTITFDSPISNFFMDIFNGNTAPVSYLVQDNMGNSTSFSLDANNTGAFQTVGFAATGSVITVLAMLPDVQACCDWDFFVDNIHFNEDLPPDLGGKEVPLPAALPLFFAGITGLGMASRRRRKAA
ncbi:MAG: VPLPA-CTERM sorting domain-containing protein [Parvularculaceae bacterium]